MEGDFRPWLCDWPSKPLDSPRRQFINHARIAASVNCPPSSAQMFRGAIDLSFINLERDHLNRKQYLNISPHAYAIHMKQ